MVVMLIISRVQTLAARFELLDSVSSHFPFFWLTDLEIACSSAAKTYSAVH
jgi:hypothetical protein